VPEIRNEVPSTQELAVYLDESLKTSAFSLLADFPGHQRNYHPDVIEALAYLSLSPQCSEFLATFKNALFQSLQRLNQLPRTDRFWHDTNFRPTIFKLAEFCEGILSSEPDDVLSILTISAMTIFHTGEFKRGRWKQLYALNALSLEMIVFAAMLLEASGADDRREFSGFIKSTGTSAAVKAFLEKIASQGGKLLSEWSCSVTASLATH
jgi:hypothetical protein